MPGYKELCSSLGISSVNTVKAHLKYLQQEGFVVDCEDFYVLPDKEKQYHFVPLELLKFMRDALSEKCIKVYLYLAQRVKIMPEYEFTLEELAKHIGTSTVHNQRGRDQVTNALKALRKLGLLDFEINKKGCAEINRVITKFEFDIPNDLK